MQPIAIPWLSPNEVTVKSFPMVFPDMTAILTAGPPRAHARPEKNSAATRQTRGQHLKTVSRIGNIDTLRVVTLRFPGLDPITHRPTMRTLWSLQSSARSKADD